MVVYRINDGKKYRATTWKTQLKERTGSLLRNKLNAKQNRVHITNINPAKSVTLRKPTDTSRVKKSRHGCAHAKDTGQVTNALFQGLPYFVQISFLHKAKKNETGDHQGHDDPVNRVITETCGDWDTNFSCCLLWCLGSNDDDEDGEEDDEDEDEPTVKHHKHHIKYHNFRKNKVRKHKKHNKKISLGE